MLMIRVEICPDITLSSENTLTFPLIMYSECVDFDWTSTKIDRKMSGDWRLL